MKVIEDKQDRFGNFPIWFNSHNLKDISEWLYYHYNGFKFAIIIDVSKEVDGDVLEKPQPVYFMGDIAEEVAQEAGKKLIDKAEYEKLTERNTPKQVIFKTGLVCCSNCENDTNILFGDKYCVECGQHLDWSSMI